MSEETYGRGGGERYGASEHPRSYAPSGAMDWRRAMRAYVAGHDRGREADRKYREADERVSAEGSPVEARRSAEPGRAREPEAGEERAGDATAGAAGGGTRYGVPVARELAFHRGASVWRENHPPARGLPRHGSRSSSGPGRSREGGEVESAPDGPSGRGDPDG